MATIIVAIDIGALIRWMILGRNTSARVDPYVQSSGLVFQLSETKKFFDSKELRVLNFKLLSGIICRPDVVNGSILARIGLEAKDATGKTYPVGTSIEELSDKDGFFSYVTEFPLPHKFNSLNSELSMLSVPLAALHFPFKGKVRLSAKLIIVELQIKAGKIQEIAGAEAELTIFSDELGYIDCEKNSGTTAEIAVKLATILASADGHADSREADIVKKYIVLKVVSKGKHDENMKKRLNDAVREAYNVAQPQISTIRRELCLRCVDFPLNHKLEIIELLLQVTRADGVAKKEEIAMLDEIVKEMKVDFDEYKKLRDKMISIDIYDKQGGEINARNLLGIRDDMNAEEIQKLLNKEYRKWNSLQNSSDAAIKAQAQKIIRLIAEEKAKLRKK